MADGYYITVVVQDFIFGLVLLFASIYSCLILFISRFRHCNNIFILNICLSIVSFSIYFIIYFTMSSFVPQLLWTPYLCPILYYAYYIVNITTPLSFVSFTVHRFYSIAYHTKPFFKTQRWVIICIGSQRILELILALPCLLKRPSACRGEIWRDIYTLIMTVFIPLLINTVFNALIFMRVRASTRRVQPQAVSITANGDNNQRSTISRRDILLLRQMVITFCIFIIGWTPTYAILLIINYIKFDPLIVRYCTIVGGLAVLIILLNLFECNHEIKKYLINKIRQYI